MANIIESVMNWATTASSNQPDTTDALSLRADLQAIQAAVRSMSGAVWTPSVSVSGTTLPLSQFGSATYSYIHNVSGANITTITSQGTSEGRYVWLRFSGATLLTHNSTSFILPGGSDITTASGDVALFQCFDPTPYWKCIVYTKADGTPVALGADSVTTAKIINDAVTYAKMQNVSATSRVLGRKTAGSGDVEECTFSEVLDFVGSAAQGDIMYRDASAWARLGAGTSGKVLRTQGSGANPTWGNASTLGTPTASTSGTTIDYTSIPSGTKAIHLMLDGVSLSGTDNLLIQIGDSGGIETSGYGGAVTILTTSTVSTASSSSSGFQVTNGAAAAQTWSGIVTLRLLSSSANTWAMSATIGRTDSSSIFMAGGSKSLSAELDRVRFATTGSNTFDAGTVNIQYE